MIEKMKVGHIVAAQTQKTELLDALRALGIEGAIVGKALYQGAFTLADALAVAGYGER